MAYLTNEGLNEMPHTKISIMLSMAMLESTSDFFASIGLKGAAAETLAKIYGENGKELAEEIEANGIKEDSEFVDSIGSIWRERRERRNL